MTALRRRMLTGAAWQLALRLLTRTLGITATVVVARSIPQSELGAYGVIVILDAGILALTSVGLGAAIIQMEDDPRDFVDTAWTVDAARAVAAYLFQFAIAPTWCEFFRVPEAATALRVYALGQLILGLHSASTILLTRELRFGRLVVPYAAESLLFSGLSVVGAHLTGSMWALVAASLVANLGRVTASYLIHPYRPTIRFEPAKAMRMFRFVRWTMANSGADFALEMTDNAVTGRILGPKALAHYRMGYQMAMEGPVFLQWIVGRVAFPSIARVQGSRALVRKNALGILAFTAATIAPAAVMLGALAPRIIEILLGPAWLPAAGPLRILAIAAFARALIDVAPPILRGLGNTRTDFLLKLTQVILMIALLVPFGRAWGLNGIALAVVVAAGTSLPIVLTTLARTLDIPAADVLRVAGPPTVAALVAAAAFTLGGTFLQDAVATTLFCLAYVGLSALYVRLRPDWGVGATRGIGDEAA